MRLAFTAALLAWLGACAALSDVTELGGGAFMTAAHSNDVNARVDEQKAKVLDRARSFCADRHLRADTIRLDASTPPPGQAPSAKLEFRCVGAN